MRHISCLKLSLYLCLLHIEFMHGSSIKSKYGNFDVDYILKKVMISKNFDSFAEKIADKAVEKFQKLQNTEKVYSKNYKDTFYRVSEMDTKEPNNTDEEEATTEPRNISEENEQVEILNEKVVNVQIDLDAFKKKEPKLIKELSLKYNRFTTPQLSIEDDVLTDLEDPKPNESKESSKITITTIKAPEQHEDLDEERSSKEGVDLTKETTAISSENKLQNTAKGDVESGDSEDTKHHDESKKYEGNSENIDHKMLKKNGNKSKKTESNKDERKELAEDESIESLDKDKAKDEKSKNYKRNPPAYEYLQLPAREKANKTNNNRLKNDYVKTHEPATDENIKDTNEILENLNDATKGKVDKLSGKSNTKKQANPITVRKEGNKLYAQVNSPDYEEYHQEIERIQKHVQDNKRKANDFRNKKQKSK